MTVKELADELGKSKTAIYQAANKTGIRSAMQKVNGVYDITEDQATVLRAHFKTTRKQPEAQQPDGSQQDADAGTVTAEEALSLTVSILREQAEVLKQQLEEKDQLIRDQSEQIRQLTSLAESLNAQNAELAASVHREQYLHAGTMGQLPQAETHADTNAGDTMEPEEKKPRRKGFLAWLFGEN